MFRNHGSKHLPNQEYVKKGEEKVVFFNVAIGKPFGLL